MAKYSNQKHPSVRGGLSAASGMVLAAGLGVGADAQEPAAAQGPVEEVTVTGSRIARTNATTPTPVTVLDAERFQLAGDNRLADTLNTLPALGTTQSDANSNDNQQIAGANFLDLRRLGIERTLVLINGQRQVASQVGSAAVDVNTIPQALVERVEVITGGASAVYGADAVSGVVNFILKDDFEGLAFTGRVGIAEEGDGEVYQISATGGTNFADGRGNVYANITYDRTEPVFADDRDFTAQNVRFAPNPANTGPNDGIPDQIPFFDTGFIGTPAGGQVVGPNGELFEAAGGPFTFAPGGALVPQDLGDLPAPFLTEGGDAVDLSQFDLLRVPVERIIFTGGLTYDIVPALRFFMTSRYAQSTAETFGQPTFTLPTFVPSQIDADNPFVPPALQQILADNDLDSFFVGRTNVDQGGRDSRSDRDTLQLSVGFEGAIFGDIDWSLRYGYGRTDNSTEFINEPIGSNFQQAIDATTDADGTIVCTDPSGGCVPLNLLGPDAATPEALAFVYADFLTEGRVEQNVVTLTFTGDSARWFDLPGGPIGWAVGAEYRSEFAETEEGVIRNTGEFFPGAPIPDVSGRFDVGEVFAEIAMPVLRDQPFAHELNIDAAVRYAEYNTIGQATTFKFGGDWSPIPDIRLRGVYSRAVRAPNIGELFAPADVSNQFLIDPCDTDNLASGTDFRAGNCAALGLPPDFESQSLGVSTTVLTGGNPDLEAETADTFTVGVVFTPEALPGFSFAVDYFDIEIEDAINSFDPEAVLANCVDLPDIGNAFCDNIQRDPLSGQLTQVSSQLINVAAFQVEGIDFELSYFADLPELTGDVVPGTLDIRWVATYLRQLDFFAVSTDDAPDAEAGELGDPQFSWNLFLTWRWDRLTVAVEERFIGDQRADLAFSDEFQDPITTGIEVFTDVQLRYQLLDGLDLGFGVNNLFDNEPPLIASVPEVRAFGDDAVIFDQIGRFFYLTATVQF